MSLNKKNIKNLTELLSSYYSKHYACLVSGSYVDGTNNQYSDIDLIIFTKNRNTVFNETLLYETLKVQAIVIPIQNIQEIFWVDYITSKGAFIDMIAKGRVISDNDDFLKHLVPHTKKLKKQGGRPLSEEEVFFKRVKITSLLLDVMGGNNISELLFPINSIMELISEFKLKVGGNWCGDGKYRMRDLKRLDNEFYTNLICSLKEVYANNNKQIFTSLITNEMNNYGGLIPYYSKVNALSKVSTDYLVIEINTGIKINANAVQHTIRVIDNLIKSINYKEIRHYFFSSKPVGKNKIEQNVYVVIDTDKEFINDYLIDRFNLLIESNTSHSLSKLTCPFQFDPRYRFSNDNIYNSLSPIFHKTSKFSLDFIDNIFSESKQIQVSLHLMKSIKKVWFDGDKNLFIDFLDYLKNCWLVFSYDDGTNFNTSNLLKTRNKIPTLLRISKIFINIIARIYVKTGVFFS